MDACLTEIKPVFSDKSGADYKRKMGEIKRILERWTCDNLFRENLSENYAYASQYFNFDFEPDEIQILTNYEFCKEYSKTKGQMPLVVQQYQSFTNEKVKHRNQLQTIGCDPENKQISKWRRRQINRCSIELGAAKNAAIIHSPINFELTKGCSVGCWFCAVASEKLSKVFSYTPENRTLWREILHCVKKILGDSGNFGTCYYATEPLDNPDYEKFILDYKEILGYFPQTTTAVAHKYPERIREILKLSRENGGFVERFSILSLPILDKIHKEFLPEELVRVELLPQTNESNSLFAKAGRAAEQTANKKVAAEGGTIACITGFLINMAEKSIKFVTPCKSDSVWPLGYWTIASDTFTNVDELEIKMNNIISKYAKMFVEFDDVLRFHKNFKYKVTETGFEISSDYMRVDLKELPMIKEIGELINLGNKTAGEIAMKLSTLKGEPLENVFYSLNTIFDLGILDEEPDVQV